VLVVEEKPYSSAAQATSAAAEASSEAEAEEKHEPSEVIEGTDETDDIDGAGMTAKAPLVEEKPRVIAPPGDGRRIYETDPMLEGFWCHLDYR
jgi:1,4-alpha-glucan branching enzyme